MRETENGYVRRKQIMMFIQKYISENGYSPSQREIGDGVGLKSLSTVNRQLETLKTLGMINFTPGIARTISVKEARK